MSPIDRNRVERNENQFSLSLTVNSFYYYYYYPRVPDVALKKLAALQPSLKVLHEECISQLCIDCQRYTIMLLTVSRV